jgi:acetoin utilization deacetylase AcuC-like enzyme
MDHLSEQETKQSEQSEKSVDSSEASHDDVSISVSKSASAPDSDSVSVSVSSGDELIDKLMTSIKQKAQNSTLASCVGLIDDPICDEHKQAVENHQESPFRTKAIRNALYNYGILEFVDTINCDVINKNDLYDCHEKAYIDMLFKCAKSQQPVVLPLPSREATMESGKSVRSIIVSVASAITAVKTVCKTLNSSIPLTANEKVIKRMFCNIRPPGHHADHSEETGHSKGSGFCFINNIAVAAIYALNKYPDTIKKVLIFDWDLHHGDGTENIFKNNPNVMYVSFHRGGEGDDAFYPFTGTQHFNDLKNVVNFPIAQDETAESYMDKFNNEFLPLAYEFKPDLVMISAGFDSHKDDLYGELPLDYIHFHQMTKSLVKLANDCASKRLVSLLEGGYYEEPLGTSVAVHMATMIDEL